MFLNPLLLLGATGIAVPIIIHLLNRRKFQRVAWAAMRFVKVSLEKNKQRMLVENLILLAVRCLIVLLLAMALARPALVRGGSVLGRQPATVAIVLDQSGSMSVSNGVQTRFDAARQAADAVIARLPSGSSVALFLASDTVRDVIPQPTLDLTLARQDIAHAAATDRGTNLLPAMRRALAALSSVRGSNKHVYVISDGQAVGWRQGASGVAPDVLNVLDNNRQIATHLIFISDHDTRNVAVTGLRLATELPTAEKPLRIEAEVRNEGAAAVREVSVRLFADGGPTPLDQGIIEQIPARSSKSIALTCKLPTDGYHVMTARIAKDQSAADDERSLVVRVLGQVRVLLVNGEPGKMAQEEDAFFVRNALQPVPVEQRPTYFIQTQTIDTAELEQVHLDKYDVVVLANVADLSRATVAALERLVGEGRGLMVFAGPRINGDFYRDVLYRQHGLLPAWFGTPHGNAAQSEQYESLQSGGFKHPITLPWNQEGQGNPASARFYRTSDLTMDAASSTAPAASGAPGAVSIVANYASGKPAIVERSFGQGRVIMFGTTANTLWTDLPARGSIFVPLMHRTLDRLLHRQEMGLNLTAGQTLKLRRPGDEWGKNVRIIRPTRDGSAEDLAHLEMVDNWPTLLYDRTDQSGVYKIAIEGATADQPGFFAVAPSPMESDLEELSSDELKSLSSRASVTSKQSDESLKDTRLDEGGVELWRPIITAVVALLVVESIFAFWFSRVK